MWTAEETMKLRVAQTGGKTVEEIARELGKTPLDIRNKLISLGHKPREASTRQEEPEEKRRKTKKHISLADMKRVEELMVDGYSNGYISKVMGADTGTVARWRKALRETGECKLRAGVYKARYLGPKAGEKKEAPPAEAEQSLEANITTPKYTPKIKARQALAKRVREELEKGTADMDSFTLGRAAGMLDMLIEMEDRDETV